MPASTRIGVYIYERQEAQKDRTETKELLETKKIVQEKQSTILEPKYSASYVCIAAITGARWSIFIQYLKVPSTIYRKLKEYMI